MNQSLHPPPSLIHRTPISTLFSPDVQPTHRIPNPIRQTSPNLSRPSVPLNLKPDPPSPRVVKPHCFRQKDPVLITGYDNMCPAPTEPPNHISAQSLCTIHPTSVLQNPDHPPPACNRMYHGSRYQHTNPQGRGSNALARHLLPLVVPPSTVNRQSRATQTKRRRSCSRTQKTTSVCTRHTGRVLTVKR